MATQRFDHVTVVAPRASKALHARMAHLSAALTTSVSLRPVPAPFSKLVVTIVPDARDEDGQVSNAFGICEVTVSTDAASLDPAIDYAGLRALVVRACNRALAALREAGLAFDAEPFERAVTALIVHDDRVEVELPHLCGSGLGTNVVTSFWANETSVRLRARVTSGPRLVFDGPITEADDPYLHQIEHLLPAERVRIDGKGVAWVTTDGRELVRVAPDGTLTRE